jgi:hypothetical protein
MSPANRRRLPPPPRAKSGAANTGSRSRAMTHIRLVPGTTTRQTTAHADVVRPRGRPLRRRLLFASIAFAIVLLALAGWTIQALRTTEGD